MTAPSEDRKVDGPPPFWGRWTRIYAFVAALLLVQVLAFYALTRWTS